MALTRYNYWMPSMGGQTAAMDAALETPARGSYTSGSRASGQERTGAGKTPAPFDAAASGVSSGLEDRGRHTVPESPRPLAGGGCCVGRATRHSHQRYEAREKLAWRATPRWRGLSCSPSLKLLSSRRSSTARSKAATARGGIGQRYEHCLVLWYEGWSSTKALERDEGERR